jgi:antitoxin component YwqK of YwqJK toxin-antitoxin module
MNQQLIRHLSQFKDCVFKSCNTNWIVTLQRTANTITNESREGIYDHDHAKFRGNEFEVVDIVNKFDPNKKTDKVINTKRKFTYAVGTITKPANGFDENLNKICSQGIHYFKTFEPSFYYSLSTIPKGIYRNWYSDGRLMGEYEFHNGTKHGMYIRWHDNGYKCIKGTYIDDKEHGRRTTWYDSGIKMEDYDFICDNAHGPYISWHNTPHEQKMEQFIYDNWKITGDHKKWDIEGNLICE